MTAATEERVAAPVAAPRAAAGRRGGGRLGALAGALLLVAVAALQRPGEVTFDTKLDLAVDPLGFMARALHLWNPEATSGELQNQAYGYLFPIGPFFAAGDLLGVPPWITQRAWCALLLCTAYLGVLLLAGALRIGSPSGRVIAALAYALAPRMLTEIGPLSSEMLPVVMLPWVVLPLVAVRRIGSPRRAAALSGLAVLGMGGINAAAVVMALVLPALWLATRERDRHLVRLALWWCVCVGAATLWWVAPLLLFGQYSLPFLDYIESSATTTAITSLFQATRGTNQWVGYIVQGEPWWPAGWILVDNPVLMAATALVAVAGLAGLALPGLPERRFLVLGMLTGLTLLTVGYLGTLDSPFAATVRDLLDGPLAPLRNVHKFEPVLRLPIVLGLAYAASQRIPLRRLRVPAVPVVAALLIAAAAPAWLFLLRPGPGWAEVPAHWRQAASWLSTQDARARTLVVPGQGFAQNTWGRTVDEPIQPLAGAPWSTRHQIPLGSEGNIRVMDTVEAVLAQGRGSPGLADFLARSGYRYLLVRHDIDRAATGAPPIAVIRRAIAGSPGLAPVATFGPAVTATEAGRSPVDATPAVPSIEIFQVRAAAGGVPVASATALSGVPVVSGGPESLLPLLEQGLVDGRQPAVLAGDAAGLDVAGRPWIVTDGLRRRELNVGRMRDNLSHTLTAGEQTRQRRLRGDLTPFATEGHATVAAYQGIRSVDASSGTAFADTVGATDPSYLPFAALDGDRRTAWRSDPFADPVGQWLEVTFDTPRRVDGLDVDWVDDLRVASPVGYVRITTDQGAVDREVPESPGPHRLSTLPGLTTKVRVTVLALRAGHERGAVALGELGVPGLDAQRGLRVPDDAAGGRAPIYAFSRAPQDRGACYSAGGQTRCDQFLARAGEEPLGLDRFFSTPVPSAYDLRLTARPRPGAGEFRSEERSDAVGPSGRPGAPGEQSPGGPVPVDLPVTASASSVLAGDATVGAHAAIDGDPATAWLAEPVDGEPTLRLAWDTPRRIDRLRLVAPSAPVAATPRAVLLRTPAGETAANVDPDGWVTFPRLTTDRIEIEVTGYAARVADPRGGWPAPVGVAEVEVPGLAGLLRPATAGTVVAAPCGSGPTVEIDGVAYPTSVSGTLADVREGRQLPLSVCDEFTGATVELAAGEHRLRTTPSPSFVVDTATLVPGRAGPPAPPVQRGVEVVRWAPTARTLEVAGGEAALLVVAENFNAGWSAALDGHRLPAIRVDGWQQAFEVPAGAGGTVTLTFTPDRPYRAGLAAGAGAVALVGLLALVPGRRRRSLVLPARPGSWWIAVPLVALAVALGGAAAAALLLAAMLVRQLRPGALPGIAVVAGAAGAAVAVVGRVQGHGQEWAYGGLVQAAMLVAVTAVAATLTPSPRAEPEPAPVAVLEPVDPYRATLGRSVRLFRGFLHEQTDPDRFYSMLAADSVRQLGSYVDLRGAVVLDVGGGPGYFAAAFREAGATYVGLDPDAGDFVANGAPVSGMVRGAGTALPVRSGAVDVSYSSNVLEHVPAPEAMLDEMLRVTRPGGTVFVSFTPWLSPWGGHETAPWHYLGGERARRRYVRRKGREPKNRYRQTLFPISAARAMRWARKARREGRVEIVTVLPRYHPWWACWIARFPVLREFLTWNFTMILRHGRSQGSQQM